MNDAHQSGGLLALSVPELLRRTYKELQDMVDKTTACFKSTNHCCYIIAGSIARGGVSLKGPNCYKCLSLKVLATPNTNLG